MRQNAVLFSNWTCSFLPLPQNWIRTCLPILVKKNNTFSHFLAEDLKVSPYFNQSNWMHSIQTLFCLAFKACPSLPPAFYLSKLIFHYITTGTFCSSYMDLSEPCVLWAMPVFIFWVKLLLEYLGPFPLYLAKVFLCFKTCFRISKDMSYHNSTILSSLELWFLSLQLENTTYWRKKFENFLYDLR